MRLGLLISISLFAGSIGCGAGGVPDPKAAALEYAALAESGDAEGLHAMLSNEAKKQYSVAEVRAIVDDEKTELAAQAKELRMAGTKVKTEATVRYGDGEHAALTIEQGEYRLRVADALPAESRTPVQALEQLRRVIARRSYAGLVRVLSPATRAAMEEDLRSLVEGLEDPGGLDVDVTGDSAVVAVPGGHLVRLKRAGGVWHIEDFD